MELIKSLLVMVAFILIANKANALPIPTFGVPIESGSWIQHVSFPGDINIGAGGFEAPGVDNFVDNSNNLTDWTGSAVNSTYALAKGADPFQDFDVFLMETCP